MGAHPANLLLRFLLEIVALISMGFWAYGLTSSNLRLALMIVVPLLFATIWGVFAVPNDPSRSGNAPVPIRGWLRLIFELLFVGFSVWCLYRLALYQVSFGMGLIVLVHYFISYDRVAWLMRR